MKEPSHLVRTKGELKTSGDKKHNRLTLVSFPSSVSDRSDSERQAQPVTAVRQQRRDFARLPGRRSHGHDQSAVLQRPADPAETLSEAGRQRMTHTHTVTDCT